MPFNNVNLPLGFIFDVRIDQETVHLRVDVLDRNLESVEEPRLGHLDFLAESLHLKNRIVSVPFYK